MNTIVIAEIGENHYGRWDICRGLVKEAAANGATFAKFQAYTADQFGPNHPLYEWFKSVEMPQHLYAEMQSLCRELGIGFLCSTFTIRSTKFLVDQLGVDAVKIASSRLANHDLLNFINSRSDQIKTVYMSTGMCELNEVRSAVARLNKIEHLYLLHCTSQYPTEDENVNLRAMSTLMREFSRLPVGFSDHSCGIEACLAAVALGAVVLEKHITYSTSMPGDDHACAMTPQMLREMTQRIERIEVMLGNPAKALLTAERNAVTTLRVPLAEVGFE
jgi:sialic acid synthase SpsE